MPVLRPLQQRPAALAAIASLGLHLALLGALAVLPRVEQLRPEPEESVEVELVTPEQIEPQPEPPAAPPAPQTRSLMPPVALPAQPAPTQPQPAPPVPPPIPAPPVMVRARRLLSDEVLASPLSRGTREALRQLEESERIEQLCNLEAMGQIHAWKAEFEPERVVAYAMEGAKLAKTVLQADGAAFRSKRQWYRLKFTCELSPDRARVVGFEFMVGEPVPRREWQARNLPAEH